MSLQDELRRPQVKALVIGGGVLILLAIAIYFATKKGQGALASSNPNGLNADASGQVPTVLVLPPPVIFGPPTPGGGGGGEAPTVQPPLPAQSPPLPAQSPPLGIISPSGIPPAPAPPILPGPTGPLGMPLGIANH